MRCLYKCPVDLWDFGKYSSLAMRVQGEICSTIFSMSDGARTADDYIDGFARSTIGELA